MSVFPGDKSRTLDQILQDVVKQEQDVAEELADVAKEVSDVATVENDNLSFRNRIDFSLTRTPQSFSILGCLFFYYSKCDFPIKPHVRLLVGQLAGRSVIRGKVLLDANNVYKQ